MKVLFLSFNGFFDYNGISKKKLAQIKGIEELGCKVVNCYYTVHPENGHRFWMADDHALIDLGRGAWAKIRKRIDYKPLLTFIKNQQVSVVYIRSDHNATPFFVRFVKKLKQMGIKVVMEIPTYPYDQEYSTCIRKSFLLIDRLCRKSLAKQLQAMVTFSNALEIFGQRTIRISNGIDFSSIRIKQNHHTPGELHLIGVAEIHYWHGFDRVVAGLRDYYRGDDQPFQVCFHIVGEFAGTRERDAILSLITENQLEKYVTLHGRLFGAALDKLFDLADMGIGSLGRHRSGITFIKTLKNREYAARGIPFIYSETDVDFEAMPYIMKVPADDSPVNIESIIDFFHKESWDASAIRKSVAHLSWRNQMQKVMEQLALLPDHEPLMDGK